MLLAAAGIVARPASVDDNVLEYLLETYRGTEIALMTKDEIASIITVTLRRDLKVRAAVDAVTWKEMTATEQRRAENATNLALDTEIANKIIRDLNEAGIVFITKRDLDNWHELY